MQATILQVVPELDAGGAELTTLEVAEAVVRGGGRALVATEGGRMRSRIAALGAELVDLPVASKNPFVMLANARRLSRMVAAERVSLVHARSRAPAWSAEWAARRNRVPFVTTYHGAYSERMALKKAYNAVMARGDIVIANSEYTAALVRERYDIPGGRIRTINRGFDHAKFDQTAVDADRRTALRQTWNVAGDAFVVLHPARLTRIKGQLVTVAAARSLKQAGGRMPVFVLAGDAQGRTDYVGALNAAISEAGLQEHVRLVGHVSDMPAAIGVADLVLMTSVVPETFGRTSVEAQGMGVPVIATTIGAQQTTLIADDDATRTGWLVPPGDADALASAVKTAMMLDPNARAAVSERARCHARAAYSTGKLQQETLAVYDELLGTRMVEQFLGGSAIADLREPRAAVQSG